MLLTYIHVCIYYHCISSLHHYSMTAVLCAGSYNTVKGPALFPYTESSLGALVLHLFQTQDSNCNHNNSRDGTGNSSSSKSSRYLCQQSPLQK